MKSACSLHLVFCLIGARRKGRTHRGTAPKSGYSEWPIYGGGWDRIRYSALTQINRDNVARLRVAWTYETGDAFSESEIQCNPIVVDGVLFARRAPKLRVFALDAAKGRLH